jgi:hypothetical protein
MEGGERRAAYLAREHSRGTHSDGSAAPTGYVTIANGRTDNQLGLAEERWLDLQCFTKRDDHYFYMKLPPYARNTMYDHHLLQL